MKFNSFLYLLVALIVVSCESKDKKTSNTPLEESTKVVIKDSKSLYEDMEGNPIDLAYYKGKKVLLNYWATWCVPCIEEMPGLLQAQELLQNDNYVFLLASDESKEKIKKFMEIKQYDFNFIQFKGSLSKEKIFVLPTTFIFNEKGEKIEEIIGAVDWDSEDMIYKLKNMHK